MVFEAAHSKILEYLHKHGQVNTFRLSRHLNMDRIEIINQVEELTNQGMTEFRYGTVKVKEKLDKRNDDTVLANINNNMGRVLKNQISRIKYFNANSPLKILSFDKSLNVNMLITLWNKFGLNKRDMDGFVSDNKNLGVFLNFSKKDGIYENNWKQFIDLFFPKKKSTGRYNNILVSKDYSMLLIVTERKILLEDLKGLNKMIFRINTSIKEHNDKNSAYQTISR